MSSIRSSIHACLLSARTKSLRHVASLVVACWMLNACASSQARVEPSAAADEVRLTELAFAKSMADRDFPSFENRLSRDAVFFGDDRVQRGRDDVAIAWKPYFSGSRAPFSWAPDHVEILPSGGLALSTGAVKVGDRVVARFNSIWRREAPHTWRIVFDKGEPVCEPQK
jgi:ketosteroid isomerase-like protein